jgi:hypothetical protein
MSARCAYLTRVFYSESNLFWYRGVILKFRPLLYVHRKVTELQRKKTFRRNLGLNLLDSSCDLLRRGPCVLQGFAIWARVWG